MAHARRLSYVINNLSLDKNYLIAAAIDFGTTFSGYAFSFKASPADFRLNKNWGAEVGCQSHKAPTCILTKPDGSFHSFGYKAEQEYSNLDPDEDTIGGPYGYNLYRNFKMILHNKVVTMHSTVVSVTGHARKALDIFAMALEYLKGHLMEPLQMALKSPPDPSYIRWVLTVPAIWDDEAKRFMREAAFKAGLIADKNSTKLLFALEPEAASIYCRSIDVNIASSDDSPSHSDLRFRSGEKLLIIDAGGGTVDITAHKILMSGEVDEIHAPSGGPWGGITVDQNFVALLSKSLGPDFINKFKADQPQQWLHFMTNFERSKKSYKPGETAALKIPLPFSLGQEFSSFEHKRIEELKVQGVSFKNGFLTIKGEKVSELFAKTVTNICEHVASLLSQRDLANLSYVLLVGGFGECKMLQASLQSLLRHKGIRFLIPDDPQLVIVKGALLYGHNPCHVSSRIAKFTYGIKKKDNFVEGIHNTGKRFIDKDGTERCQDLFDAFVTKAQTVKNGEYILKSYTAIERGNIVFGVYKTARTNVLYVDEPGVTFLGEATLQNVTCKDLEMKVTFGHTELLIEAREKGMQNFPLKMNIDFLAD